MVEFRPVEGWEYNLKVAGAFGDLIAPPYDVIDAARRKELVERSRYNVVRLTLPEAEGSLDKYAAAAALLDKWLRQGVFARCGPAFYVIEQTFTLFGRRLLRTGVLGQARLSPWREGGIYPHEVTLPKPREDRLNLYRATRVAPGPSFSLFEDRGGAVRAAMDAVKASPRYREADGPEGSYDRVWKIEDPAVMERLARAFADERFFIADGHHRYETALAFRDELAAGGALPADHPANFVLMCAVPFDDPGLVILPTHRLLTLDAADAARGLDALGRDYAVVKADDLGDFGRPGARATDTIAVRVRGESYFLRMKEAARKAWVEEAGGLMADLNVIEVRQRVLPRFFEDVSTAISSERIKYSHEITEAIRRVDDGEFGAAVMLSPVTVRQMAAVAGAGNTMPPKSTYFYPKLPTGVVIKPLS